jgi:hypothetical protein
MRKMLFVIMILMVAAMIVSCEKKESITITAPDGQTATVGVVK